MPLVVNVLAGGFGTPNGRAFVFPLLRFRRELLDAGIAVNVHFHAGAKLTDCDLLAIDSKYYRSLWRSEAARILEHVQRFREEVRRLYWFDNADSTGSLQARVIPFVDAYCKGHLLTDRGKYVESWYGGRIYTDYYHKKHGVTDSNPVFSIPLRDDTERRKLRLSWNAAYWNHSYSPAGNLLAKTFELIARRPLFHGNRKWCPPGGSRNILVSARFSTGHSRPTVAYQRTTIRRRLLGLVPLDRVSRKRFREEMEKSKMVVSPFGWGEVTYRDYECFIAGSVLVKPDMSHVETWPDLYRAYETYVPISWDVEDLRDKIDRIASEYKETMTIATRGQDTYRNAIVGHDAGVRFAQHVRMLFEENATANIQGRIRAAP